MGPGQSLPRTGGRSRRRVGLFGGTFDPPHRGHVSVARDVADAIELDEVLWIVAGRPPHKAGVSITPGATRMRMVEAAAAVDPRFRVSDLELRRGGPSYTVDTLRALVEAGDEAGASPPPAEPNLKGAELFLILGIDQYRAFETWRQPAEIRRMATLAVMDRDGTGVDEARLAEGVVRVPVRRVDVSATEIREAVERGEDVTDRVPRAVARIIAEEGLYRASPPMPGEATEG